MSRGEVVSNYDKKPIRVGPWGGQDGVNWDDGVYSSVRQLVIAQAAGIDSLQIEYDLKGSSVWSEKHGGSGGIKTDRVKLDYPNEFLTSIHGHYGSINEWGPIFVRSLTIESNKKTYGPYGIEQGTQFSFPITGGKIVGFHGKGGWYIDSIGVYLKPLYNPNPFKSLVSSPNLITASATEKISSYTVVQGSIGQDFDIVLAFKQKNDNGNLQPAKKNVSSKRSSSSSHSSSSSSSDDESPKNKVINQSSSFADGPIPYGPWGGSGGTIFDDGTFTGIRQVYLTRNAGITSIRVLYDRNGQAIWGSKNGGSGGIRTDKIIFDYPYEVLTHISGYFGPAMIMGPNVIKSLTFHTTKKKYGPFGDEQGTFFSSNLKEGMVVGFHGRKGWFIDGIGVHVLEGKLSLPQPPPPTLSLNTSSNSAIIESAGTTTRWPNNLLVEKRAPREEVSTYTVVKEPAPCGPGPWGGDGGRPWDDGVFPGIKQVFLTKGEAISSIQIEYDRNGQAVWSVRHGGSAGDTTYRIKFEYPHEVVTCISGFYGSIGREEPMKVIRSLTFHTTRGSYGPYGEEIGTYFTSTKTEGKVVGFHGRSGLYLDAIGVHMQHWLGDDRRSVRSSLFKMFN
ncbi:jacalin-related lectin 3 [Telopea speciosissima]|uniref:jacalin-related lectin 3 n=1 Tax=Telopea speciosissima TaxID=54955 RepID=UPI001CC663D1|nr:jacalin-related lectin 3 [Telopea speciosissima]